MRYAALALLLLGAGCGSDEPSRPPIFLDGTSGSCTPSSCQGCCQGQTCVDPPVNAACGIGGLPCAPCPADKICQSGSCIPGSGTCDSVTCASGCCQNGQCVSGITNAACGKGGQPCTDCTLFSQTCDATSQTCQGSAACGPATCATGCCQGNQCLPGNLDSACGQGGKACADCTSTSQSCNISTRICEGSTSCGPSTCASGCCESGQCLSGTADSACGSGGAACQSCGGGTCQNQQCSGGAASYKVYLDSGQVVANPWVACQEANCDLVVTLTVLQLTATSTMIQDNNSPVWNEYLLTAPESDLTSSFVAKVYDDDYVDIKIGDCAPTVTPSILASGSLTTTCNFYGIGDTVELTFSFQKQ